MPPENDPTGSPAQISAAVQEIAERAQLLIKEEIELAKLEITTKLTKLARGAAIGAAAAIFVIGALVAILNGLSWLAWWALPVGNTQYFWGFFLVALILIILAALGGWFASRLFKAGAPPKPEMAIQEAQRIKDTVSR